MLDGLMIIMQPWGFMALAVLAGCMIADKVKTRKHETVRSKTNEILGL